MDPIQKRELKRKAWMRLVAQKRRAGLLRGRVVALSMICFAALWTIVFVQMETGNDPVLAGKAAASTRTTASAGRHGESADRREKHPASGSTEEAGTELGPAFEEVEAAPETETEVAPEVEEAEPEFEEVEPEFVEEPLVTSQS